MSVDYLRIGVIARAHGVHGAVKLTPTTDDARRFRGLSEAFLETGASYKPVRVMNIGVRPDAVTLEIEGVQTQAEAEKLRGCYLCVDRAHAVKLPADTYFVADLVGCETFDTDGNALGILTDVLQTGANDVYEIAHGKAMIPALKRVLHEVDTTGKRIVFDAAVLREVGLFED